MNPINLGGSPPRARLERIALVKDWARAAFVVPEEAGIMVTELRCREPGCPPLETVIAILESMQGTRSYKVPKSIDELTESDVIELAQTAPPPEPGEREE